MHPKSLTTGDQRFFFAAFRATGFLGEVFFAGAFFAFFPTAFFCGAAFFTTTGFFFAGAAFFAGLDGFDLALTETAFFTSGEGFAGIVAIAPATGFASFAGVVGAVTADVDVAAAPPLGLRPRFAAVVPATAGAPAATSAATAAFPRPRFGAGGGGGGGGS